MLILEILPPFFMQSMPVVDDRRKISRPLSVAVFRRSFRSSDAYASSRTCCPFVCAPLFLLCQEFPFDETRCYRCYTRCRSFQPHDGGGSASGCQWISHYRTDGGDLP